MLLTPTPGSKKPDVVQLNLDYVLSMFEIIQTMKKCDRSCNDHVNTKGHKIYDRLSGQQVLYILIYIFRLIISTK